MFLTNGVGATTLVASVPSGTQPDGVVVAGHPLAEPATLVDMRLRVNSPCLRSGQFLTKVTSDSSAGVSLTVADVDYFSDGFGVVAGDIIAFEGSELQACILKVDRVHRTLTMNTAVTWCTGQGLSIALAGTVPLMDTVTAGGPPSQGSAVMSGAWSPNMGANGTPDPSVSQVMPGH